MQNGKLAMQNWQCEINFASVPWGHDIYNTRDQPLPYSEVPLGTKYETNG